MPTLTISAEDVGYLIVKAREFDVKEANSDPDSGSNATDDNMVSVLQDNDGAELVAFFDREMCVRGLRQRKLCGDVVDALPRGKPFRNVNLGCGEQGWWQSKQHQRAQRDAFFHQLAHRNHRIAIAAGGV